MDISLILILFLFGLLGGVLSGMLGVGGGIIFVPIMTFFLKKHGIEGDILVKYVLANSLGTIFFAGLISSWKQYRLGQFFLKQVVQTASLAMLTSFLISQLIVNYEWYSQEIFAYVFVGLLLFTLLRFWLKKDDKMLDVKEVPPYKFPLTGSLTGIVTALSGLGGGVVMIPLFTQFCKLNMRQAASISIGVIPLIAIPVILSYGVAHPQQQLVDTQIGYLLPHLIFPVIGGLLFAAPFGVSLAQRLSNTVLKIIFASLILFVIINTIASLVT